MSESFILVLWEKSSFIFENFIAKDELYHNLIFPVRSIILSKNRKALGGKKKKKRHTTFKQIPQPSSARKSTPYTSLQTHTYTHTHAHIQVSHLRYIPLYIHTPTCPTGQPHEFSTLKLSPAAKEIIDLPRRQRAQPRAFTTYTYLAPRYSVLMHKVR